MSINNPIAKISITHLELDVAGRLASPVWYGRTGDTIASKYKLDCSSEVNFSNAKARCGAGWPNGGRKKKKRISVGSFC